MDPGDRLELHELAALYADLIDRREIDGLDRVFTEDVVYDNTAMPGKDLAGLELVKRYMRRAGHPLAHHITNVRVEEVDGTTRVYSRVLLLNDDGTCRSGEYRDEVVRTPEGWRSRRRTFTARVRPEAAAESG